MENSVLLKQSHLASHLQSAKKVLYPAVADGVDLPDISFRWNSKEDIFVLSTPGGDPALFKRNESIYDKVSAIDGLSLKRLAAPLCPEGEHLSVTFNIIGRRAALLKVIKDEKNITIDAQWNLFIPYHEHIKALPIIHSEILNVFACAVFHYAALALAHRGMAKNEFRSLMIEAYRIHSDFLLASLDIFNKSNIYHIRPTRIWLNSISAGNDKYHFQISVAADIAMDQIRPQFLDELTGFIHKIIKNYAFRYVDYLWTQKYKIVFGGKSSVGIVVFEGGDIVINIRPLLAYADWKPAVYLSIGYAIMLAILHSSGKEHNEETIYLAAMKTWHRYLSFDEFIEQQSVRDIFSLPLTGSDEQCCSLLECMTAQDDPELVDDFMMLMNYSTKETFLERLNVLNEPRYEKKTGVYCERLWNTVRSMNTSVVRNNINYSKMIEILRNDNIDHRQLTEFLRTGYLNGRHVVDVSEWLLLRTLLYDLINTPKVFRNDYKMLLKVLTKVNKSLIAYIWILGIDHDERYEKVSAYISNLMNDIFVFNRVKIYEIVADPEECLESEAVTGYLLNWAGMKPKERRKIIEGVISDLPHELIDHLSIETPDDVDRLIDVMTDRNSGLFGFYLHQRYRWGSQGDPLTERIRANFPQLLEQAKGAILPAKRAMGGAMLLILLAQIISDERDGFVENNVITDEEKEAVCELIKQCADWGQMHFVIMIAGIAVGYLGRIDGWTLRHFDSLLGRYDAGDRVVLRSVVQFDVENLIGRALATAKDGDEDELVRQIQLLRFGVDPVVSDQANKVLRTIARQLGIHLSEADLKKRNVRDLILNIHQCMKTKAACF